MQRAIRAVTATVAVLLTASACQQPAAPPSGGTFTTIDAAHPVDPSAPINPYHSAGNAYAGYNAMRLAWPKNDPVDLNQFYPGVARSWELSADGTQATVHIHPAATWSDGTPVTGDDLRTSAAVAFTQGGTIFSAAPGAARDGALTEVRVINERTVRFSQAAGAKSTTFLNGLLQMWVLPHAVYGAKLPANIWDLIRSSSSVDPERAGAAAAAARQISALGRTLAAFGPPKDLSCGPFVLQSVSGNEAVLVKNIYFHDAARIVPDRVRLRNYADNQTIWNYLARGELDAAPFTATPADMVERILRADNSRKRTGMSQASAALAFNQSYPPFDRVQVRQALAHVIDRAAVQRAGAPHSGTAAGHTTGLVRDAATRWLGPDAVDGLDRYPVDLAKAEQLLTQAGLSRKDDRWTLADGRPFTFTIQVPAPFADWLAGARNIASQLTAFGIPVEVRTSADLATYQKEMAGGRHAAGFWLVGSGPSTYQAYLRLYGPANGWTNAGGRLRHNPPKAGGNWIGMPETVEAPGLGRVNPGALTFQLSQVSIDAQQKTVATLARLTNDQLPVIQMWDYVNVQFINESRYTTFPGNDCLCLRLSPGVWMQLGYITRK